MRKRGVSRSNLSVDVGVALPPEWCARVFRELLKHLLYMRGQIPALYDVMINQEIARQQEQLADEAADGGEQRRRRRPQRSRASQQALNFLLETEALLDAITPQLFPEEHATRAFLLLGASSAKPREAYELVFRPKAHQQEVNVDSLCRLARRELTVHANSQPEGSAPGQRCKLFVVVEGLSDAAGPPPPPSYVAKRGWRLRMTSGVHMTLDFSGGGEMDARQQSAGNDSGGGAAGAAMPVDAGNCKLWLQNKHAPKGLVKGDPS
jgi:hypothetical protein